MRVRDWLLSVAIVGCCLACSATAGQTVRWQTNLETAKRQAIRSQRMILIHFWADWCQRCKQMEREVFGRPEVAATLETAFVPVKVDCDHFPYTPQQYGVSRLPADVILSPDGQPIDKITGIVDPSEYVARLNRVARLAGNRLVADRGPSDDFPRPQGAEMLPPAPRYASRGEAEASQDGFGLTGRPAGVPGPVRSGQPQVGTPVPSHLDPQYGRYNSPLNDPGLLASTAQQPAAAPRESAGPTPLGTAGTIQLPPGNPPLGLDGYCPVHLRETERWVRGDLRWGLIHRGRTYLFASPQQRDRFDADPDGYAPAFSGNDVVLMSEQGRLVPGRREHGAWVESRQGLQVQKRVYLFAGQETFLKFRADPDRYVNALPQVAPNVARRPGELGVMEMAPSQNQPPPFGPRRY